MDQDFQHYRDTATTILQQCEGNFVAVGASAIPIAMHMASLDSSRTYWHIPFSGNWIQYVEFPWPSRLERPSYPERNRAEYQQRLDALGLSAKAIATAQAKVNLMDMVLTAAGLTSFADILMEGAKQKGLYDDVRSNLQLVTVSHVTFSDKKHLAEEMHAWPASSGGDHQLPRKSVEIDRSIVERMMYRHDFMDKPRLTAQYSSEYWHRDPIPALSSNIAAYHKMAQALGLDPARWALG